MSLEKSKRFSVREKLNIIKSINKSASISETSRLYGVSRTTLYKWLRYYKENDVRIFKNTHKTGRKANPSTLSKEIQSEIVEIALQHPLWSSYKIASHYKTSYGKNVSIPSILKILKHKKIDSAKLRCSNLEKYFNKENVLTEEQKEAILSHNTCLKEYIKESDCSNFNFLVADVYKIQKNYVYIILHAVSSYVFAWVDTRNSHKYMINLFLTAYPTIKQLNIETIITSDSKIFCGTKKPTFRQIVVSAANMQHKIKAHESKHLDGFIEHFYNSAKKDFFAKAHSFDIQYEFECWLKKYNHTTQSGFLTHDKSPAQMLNATIAVALNKKT